MYYFKQVKDEIIISVESKSVNVVSPDFIKATKTEYDNFIASLPKIESIPDPDSDRACEILANSPEVITQPEMWELLRIFGKKLGYKVD